MIISILGGTLQSSSAPSAKEGDAKKARLPHETRETNEQTQEPIGSIYCIILSVAYI